MFANLQWRQDIKKQSRKVNGHTGFDHGIAQLNPKINTAARFKQISLLHQRLQRYRMDKIIKTKGHDGVRQAKLQ